METQKPVVSASTPPVEINVFREKDPPVDNFDPEKYAEFWYLKGYTAGLKAAKEILDYGL